MRVLFVEGVCLDFGEMIMMFFSILFVFGKEISIALSIYQQEKDKP